MRFLQATTIVRREAAIALPAVLSVLLLEFVYIMIQIMTSAGSLSRIFFNNNLVFGNTILGFGIVAAMLAGVLCGTEEHENMTDDFVKRLPVKPHRVLFEKLAGSALALAVWFAGAVLIVAIVGPADQRGYFATVVRAAREIPAVGGASVVNPSRFTFETAISWSLLLFFASLAIGSWIGRTIVTAGLSGVFVVTFVFLVDYAVSRDVRTTLLGGGANIWIALVVTALSLAVTLYRYRSREGT